MPAQTQRILRTILIGVLPIALLLCSILISRVAGVMSLSDNSKVRRSLQSYEGLGLFKPSLFDQYSDFIWSKRAFTFPAGGNLEQMLESVDKGFKERPENGPEVLNLSFVQFIEQVGLLFVNRTNFAGKFQVNRPPIDDHVNLYLIDSDPGMVSKHFTNNCEYIGYYNSIICDTNLFKTYFAFIEGIKTTYDIVNVDYRSRSLIPLEGEALRKVKQLIRQSILIWVLGHEIGHATLHKNIVIKDNRRLHFDLEYNNYEKEADGFVAETLVNDIPVATNFWVTTGEFIHQEFRRWYREHAGGYKIFDGIYSREFVLNHKLEVTYNKYNVPLLLRATRIINRLLDIAPEIDSTGFYKRVSDNITTVNLSPSREASLWITSGLFICGCIVLVYLLGNGRQKKAA